MHPPDNENLLERLRQVLAPQYTVDRELAAGGMGVVFLGTDVTPWGGAPGRTRLSGDLD